MINVSKYLIHEWNNDKKHWEYFLKERDVVVLAELDYEQIIDEAKKEVLKELKECVDAV